MKGLSRLLPIIGGAIAGGAIALAVASGSTTTHSVTTTTVVQPSNSPTLPTSFSDGHSQTINQIYRAVDPGVVDITTSSTQNTGGVFGFGQTQKTEGEGAGVVFDKKGDIITDEHVVSGASSITVNFPDGTKAPATRRRLGHRCRHGGHPGAGRRRLRASPDPVRRLERGRRWATA